MKKEMFNDDTLANPQCGAGASPSTPSRLLLLPAYGQTSLQDHFSQVGVGPLGVNPPFKVRCRKGLGRASELTRLPAVGALGQCHFGASVEGEWRIGVGVHA